MPTLTLDQAFQMALQLDQAGQRGEAASILRQIITHQPSHSPALDRLGIMAGQEGNHRVAAELFHRAVVAAPKVAAYHCNLGNALAADGKIDQSIEALRQAVALQPDLVDAQYNLGVLLKQLGRTDESIAALSAAADRARFPDAAHELGRTFAQLQRWPQAVRAFEKAASLQPSADALSDLGNGLVEMDRLEEGVAALRRALALQPDHFQTISNLAQPLRWLQQFDEAIALLERARSMRPDDPAALSNLGAALAETGRTDEAIALFERALAINPNHAEARWGLAIAMLARGDYARGWPLYEARRRLKVRFIGHNFAQPEWDGGDLSGRTLFVHAEQGFGDAIQFARFIPMLAARAARVIVEARREVAPLIATVSGIHQIFIQGDAIPRFDLHCPMMSLPYRLGITLNNLPANVPYISVDPKKVEHWRRKLETSAPPSGTPGDDWGGSFSQPASIAQTAPTLTLPRRSNTGGRTTLTPSPLKVGLAWLSAPIPRNRSLSPQDLAPLAQVQNVRYYSLQMQNASPRQQLPPGLRVLDYTAEFADFADTAAMVANLDLVITIDAVMAHIAGALGKPVWVILKRFADWRWLEDRSDSPWYPTVRLYRQQSIGDWSAPMKQIASDLQNLAKKNLSPSPLPGDTQCQP